MFAIFGCRSVIVRKSKRVGSCKSNSSFPKSKGSSSAFAITITLSTLSSTFPVSSFGLTIFSGRLFIMPSTSTALSIDNLGKFSPTHCIVPVQSCRSKKLILPWSRTLSTQPASLTFSPTFSSVSLINVLCIT